MRSQTCVWNTASLFVLASLQLQNEHGLHRLSMEVNVSNLLDSSCRVAFTAYLHDLGKFAERAKLNVPAEQLEIAKQLHCPRWDQRYTHIHAAYTALAFEQLETLFPPMLGRDVAPFGAWKTTDADDSLINAAANHHAPKTYLQWIVATADRLASGFEREEFEQYNHADERKNYLQTRLHPLFEVLQSSKSQVQASDFKHRYSLAAMTVKSLFPIASNDAEPANNELAITQYQKLWDAFREDLAQIPSKHRVQWHLWFDHFDTLWQTYTHSIPAATAGQTIPDVSLYDHSKTTAALAVAMWRYHHELGHDEAMVSNDLQARTGNFGWDDEKLLLIQGDFFGIQEFIFATGADTQKKASKLLRGRSFYVSLLTELAALKVLEALELPSTSQVINAAGKFLIVAANTPETHIKLTAARAEINQWFVENTFGLASIGLASLAAAPNQFLRIQGKERPFKNLLQALFRQLEQQKFRRFDLLQQPQDAVLAWDAPFGVCPYNNRLPAIAEGKASLLSFDQISIGTLLTDKDTLLIGHSNLRGCKQLKLNIWGYHIGFASRTELNDFSHLTENSVLRRCFDLSLPKTDTDVLFNGFARRHINAYVARFEESELSDNGFNQQRYPKLQDELSSEDLTERVKTLNHLACEDKWIDESTGENSYLGVEAVCTLKGDVDNLGAIFQDDQAASSFARMASLSRQMNNFFAVYLPWLCQTKWRNTYTVFAGGDDFFLIGAWRSQLKLAEEMRTEFARYVAHNPKIHFSAGLFVTKPSTPVSYLGLEAEDALSNAKSFEDAQQQKNAVCCFGKVMAWPQFSDLLREFEKLQLLRSEVAVGRISTSYWYDILQLADLSAHSNVDPKANIWRARLGYRTVRTFKDKRLQSQLMSIIGDGIQRHQDNYRLALTTFIYTYRK